MSTTTYECSRCKYQTHIRSHYDKHMLSMKHLRLVGDLPLEIPQRYHCEKCFYLTHDRSKFQRHLETNKHRNQTTVQPVAVAQPITVGPTAVAPVQDIANIVQLVLKEIATPLTETMQAMQKQSETMTALVQKVGNTTNSHNKTFNLNFFLNEQCKDAMNIQDFVESIPINMEELEHLGERGYVEGMAQLISSQLATMDLHKRPIHCTDVKRQVLHVKHDNKWEKEVETYPILNRAIKDVSYRFFTSVGQWIQLHPEATNSMSPWNDKYLRLIKQATGGVGDFDDNNMKIMRRLARMVVVDKTGE